MNKILPFILILIGKVPYKVLYILSEVILFFLYRIFRYRIDTVQKNLISSFPKHALIDLKKIEKKFYRNFCDILLENLLLYTISEKELQNRMKLLNPEIFDSLYNKDKGAILIGAHYNNWEWEWGIPPSPPVGLVWALGLATLAVPVPGCFWLPRAPGCSIQVEAPK